jgi:molecular chaperone HscB
MIPHNFNAFVCLALPEVFDVDQPTLDKKYEDSMRAVHPDQWASPMTQSIALHHAACINHAYHLLKDPVTRAQHMLELANAWPVPRDPAILEAVWTYQETGHHPDAWTLVHACEEFALAWQRQNLSGCHKAYWWIKVHGSAARSLS